MKSFRILLISIVVIPMIVSAVGCAAEPADTGNGGLKATSTSETKPQAEMKPDASEDAAGLDTQVNDEGEVTIMATPQDLSDKAESWDFEISVDTHSVELSEDLTEVSVLIDGGGNKYQPTVWDGDPPEGHHRSGILKFKPIKPRPRSVELVIAEIGDVAERRFRWTLGS